MTVVQPKKFVLVNEEVKKRVAEFVKRDTEEVMEVVVRAYKKSRSAAQLRIKWSWIGVIGDVYGWTKNECNNYYKRRYLLDIFERDEVGMYADSMSAMRKLMLLDKAQADIAHAQIVDLSKTEHANVKQMTEFLNHIERDAISLEIRLPYPDDFGYAMGRKP